MRSVVAGMVAVATAAAVAGPRHNGVPFVLHNDYLILVQGALGATRGLTFVVDTGSTRTLICHRRAAALGLEGPTTALFAFGSRVDALEIEIEEISAGPFLARRFPALAADVSQVKASLGLRRLDGVLGLDVIQRGSLGIDFERQELVADSAEALPFTVPLHRHGAQLVVEATAEQRRLRLVVDSGVSQLVLFSNEVPGTGSPRPKAVHATHLGGSQWARWTRVDRLQLGSWSSGRLAAAVLTVAPQVTPGLDGVIGLRTFRARFVRLDFERQELAWRP